MCSKKRSAVSGSTAVSPANFGPLLIRADASPQIGTGHVMRCLALAQAWQSQGGSAFLATTTLAPALEARLAGHCEIVHLSAPPGSPGDVRWTIDLAQSLGSEWIVIDGYQFGVDYQRSIKEAGSRLLMLDDYGHADYYCADFVLNQNISARSSMYPRREPHTQLLLGTPYVLLREEFIRWAGWRRDHPTRARRMLVTLGGSDPENATLRVLQSLSLVPDGELEVVLLVGGLNPHHDEIRKAAGTASVRVTLHRNATDMPALLRWADLLISAAGSTCWEAAFFGLPSIVMVLADNQRLIAAGLAAAGVAINLGEAKAVAGDDLAARIAALRDEPSRRQRMGMQGMRLVDGLGVWRVIHQMNGFLPGDKPELRESLEAVRNHGP